MDKSHLSPGFGEPSRWRREAHVSSARGDHSVRPPSVAESEMNKVVNTTTPRRRARKLVLCFDGTGNKFHGDDADSNILKIFRMLDRTAADQYHYYQPGIGTYVTSTNLSHTSAGARLRSWYMKAKDSAVGSSFDQHVVGGYRFLMRFYSPGDEIYIFGFSRGAYIARFLSEMLDYVGLLSHGNEEMVAFAWKAFSQWQCRRSDTSDKGMDKKREMYEFMKGFRETFSRPVRRIRFLGLFDTVNSVPRFETAWMERSKFPYTARSSAKVIRHAVSIDERRAKFRQDLLYQSSKLHKDDHGGTSHGPRQMFHDLHEKYRVRPSLSGTSTLPKPEADEVEERGRRTLQPTLSFAQEEPAPYRARSRSKSRATNQTGGSRLDAASDISEIVPSDDDGYDSEDDTEQDIDEIWFAGGHGDVGGGWEVVPGTKSASHVPLTWMIREAMRAGLTFDAEKVVAMGCSDVLDNIGMTPEQQSRQGCPRAGVQQTDFARRPSQPLPNIRVNSQSQPSSPRLADDAGNVGPQPDETETETPRSHFHDVMHRAHVARIHDSLLYNCGLGFAAVTSWKLMEYMPFRRMDLKPDGSWSPIRWPLPCGEVRDIPDNVRVHGSVIRRMMHDESYRPGNLIVGGGGRGCRVAAKEYGMGEWDCVKDAGDPVGEVWVKAKKPEAA